MNPTAFSPIGRAQCPHKTKKTTQDLMKLRNIRKISNFAESLPSAQSSPQNENFVYISKKFEFEILKFEQNLNFSRSALFQMKSKTCLKFFVHDCLWKRFPTSYWSQAPSNLNLTRPRLLQILLTLLTLKTHNTILT